MYLLYQSTSSLVKKLYIVANILQHHMKSKIKNVWREKKIVAETESDR